MVLNTYNIEYQAKAFNILTVKKNKTSLKALNQKYLNN